MFRFFWCQTSVINFRIRSAIPIFVHHSPHGLLQHVAPRVTGELKYKHGNALNHPEEFCSLNASVVQCRAILQLVVS